MKKVIAFITTIAVVLSLCITVFAESLSYAGECTMQYYDEIMNISVYTNNAYGIVVQKGIDTKKQALTKENIIAAMDELPQKFTSNIGWIILTDKQSPQSKDIVASYYNKMIAFYDNEWLNDESMMIFGGNPFDFFIFTNNIQSTYKYILCHEIAHSIDTCSISEEWHTIVDESEKLYSSKVKGKIKYDEEFANTAALIIKDFEYVAKTTPNKYKYVAQILNAHGFVFPLEQVNDNSPYTNK